MLQKSISVILIYRAEVCNPILLANPSIRALNDGFTDDSDTITLDPSPAFPSKEIQ